MAFKTKIVKNKSHKEDDDSDDENLSLMIKKFINFIKSKSKEQVISDKKEHQGSSSNFKYYGCGETIHVKVDFPNVKRSKEKKGKKFYKKKKAYIAWEENDSNSFNSSVLDEEKKSLLNG